MLTEGWFPSMIWSMTLRTPSEIIKSINNLNENQNKNNFIIYSQVILSDMAKYVHIYVILFQNYINISQIIHLYTQKTRNDTYNQSKNSTFLELKIGKPNQRYTPKFFTP